jgi:hypothetical protein
MVDWAVEEVGLRLPGTPGDLLSRERRASLLLHGPEIGGELLNSAMTSETSSSRAFPAGSGISCFDKEPASAVPATNGTAAAADAAAPAAAPESCLTGSEK